MSGGSSTTSDATIRYAPYIEAKHEAFLVEAQARRIELIDDSPFSGYSDIEVDDVFFGIGYVMSSYPSMYDMFGKFMAGLDVDALYAQILEDSVNAPEINDLVAAESALLDDELETTQLPRLKLGYRNTNSVMSSSYLVAKSNLEAVKLKAVSRFSGELKYNMLTVAADRWKSHLTWNQSVIEQYSKIMHLYFSAKMDIDGFNYGMAEKDKLWPFTVLSFEGSCLGALQGATSSKTTKDDPNANVAGFIGLASSLIGLMS